jgi:hypothetical protein
VGTNCRTGIKLSIRHVDLRFATFVSPEDGKSIAKRGNKKARKRSAANEITDLLEKSGYHPDMKSNGRH